MRIPRLFVDQDLLVDKLISLPEAQAHYLRNVLRCQNGQDIVVFNGKGGEFTGVIESLDRGKATIKIDFFTPSDRESPLVVKLGLAITKRDAMDLAIQKSTELGATQITPLTSDYSTVAEKALAKRLQHWRDITYSACEQCERNLVPTVKDVTRLDDWVTRTDAELKLVAHIGDHIQFDQIKVAPKSIAILIGPEGGLSDQEVAHAVESGYAAISLGPRILRAETAPLALLSIVQTRWGDMGG